MIPKLIHLCWFSGESYPVEIRECLDSWKKILPDYNIMVWDYNKAKTIGIPFINDALEDKRWAFAADVVRFYAVWKYGGLYMDSDILLFKRFDKFIPEHGFMTFNELKSNKENELGLQAAFFMGEPGNEFCSEVIDYYSHQSYRKPDGTLFDTVSPVVMARIAEKFGYKREDTFQQLKGLTIYPTHYLCPRHRYPMDSETIGQHRIYGSWRKRKLGRRIELWFRHVWNVIRYYCKPR